MSPKYPVIWKAHLFIIIQWPVIYLSYKNFQQVFRGGRSHGPSRAGKHLAEAEDGQD